jgi:hypothetical protein
LEPDAVCLRLTKKAPPHGVVYCEAIPTMCAGYSISLKPRRDRDLKRKAGDDKGACATYEELLMIDRELVKLEDSNTDWLWNLSLSLERIGDVKLNLQDLDAAGEAYDESISILHHLVASDPSKLGWQSRVLVALKKISDLKRVAATTPPPDRERLSITQLLREGDKISEELRRKLPRYVARIRTAKDFAVDRAAATYKASLAIARNLLEQGSELGVGPRTATHLSCNDGSLENSITSGASPPTFS